MRKALTNMVRKSFHLMGMDVHRITAGNNASLQLVRGLDYFKIDTVLDIGANTGQFAKGLRSMGYRHRIVSFEPLPDAYHMLSASAAKDSLWDVHAQGAIGDVDGEIEINVSANSVSSSVLPMLDAHLNAARNSAYVDRIQVPIWRLDSLADQYLTGEEKFIMKIDTQGFEWEVLNGATDTLAKAQGVLCELSLVPLYKGQRLWRDMLERLESQGFTIWSIQKGFTDQSDGRTLQIDSILYRDPSF